MKILKYGYIGEDEAQRIFLRNYLKTYTETIVFEEDTDSKIKATNKTEVDKLFVEAAIKSLKYAGNDVFFVGRDLDDFQFKAFQEKQTSMRADLPEQFKNQVIIFVPVQCIEHWLWYLKRKADNPQSTKNESFEQKPRNDAKIAVYGQAKVPNKISNPIVEQLTTSFDTAWLASRSDSFKWFHNEVVVLVNKNFQ